LPEFSLPHFPPEKEDPEKSFLRLLRDWSSLFLLNLLQADKGQQTLPTRGIASLLFLSLGTHLDTRCLNYYPAQSRFFMEIYVVHRDLVCL
jgi:hypothetical protein